MNFSSFDILKTFSFFLRREMTCFAVVWTMWAYDDERSILTCPKRWFQFNSRIVKAHFSGIMTLNNWKMIAETRSDTFRWGSRFRRRRVCLSSLLPHFFSVVQSPFDNWHSSLSPTTFFEIAVYARMVSFTVPPSVKCLQLSTFNSRKVKHLFPRCNEKNTPATDEILFDNLYKISIIAGENYLWENK